MELIAHCEACDEPLHEGDDYHFDKDGIVWVCGACIDAEEDRLREEFGWIGVWKSDAPGEIGPDIKGACEP